MGDFLDEQAMAGVEELRNRPVVKPTKAPPAPSGNGTAERLAALEKAVTDLRAALLAAGVLTP